MLRTVCRAFGVLAIAVIAVACSSNRLPERKHDGGPKDAGHTEKLGPWCPTASECGSRQYCNKASTCICIEAAEGENVCGQVPSSCGVKDCKTSADCAEFGKGYFCDTVNSGCCDDGAAEPHQRCIAPCGQPDGAKAPDASSEDAATTQPTDAGKTPPECAAGKLCGDVCCADNERCEDGVCLVPDVCEDDEPTEQSLSDAFAALAKGETHVSLSPNGCVDYERTLDGEDITSEKLTYDGKTAFEATYAVDKVMGQLDADLDGTFEWQGSVTAPDTDAESIEFIDHLSVGDVATRHEQRTHGDSGIHVVIEENGDIVNQYDTSEQQPLNEGDLPAGSSCTLEQLDRYAPALGKCLAQTPKCLTQHKRDDLAKETMAVAAKVKLQCVDAPDYEAYASNTGWHRGPLGRRITVKLNTGRLDSASTDFVASTLCHELFHSTSAGGHDPALKGDTQREFQSDVVNACESLCGFAGLGGSGATQCQCATCTGRSVCDPVCKKYGKCEPKMGAICPCPDRHRWYESLSVCLSECPSGLKCFGYKKCVDLDRSCKK